MSGKTYLVNGEEFGAEDFEDDPAGTTDGELQGDEIDEPAEDVAYYGIFSSFLFFPFCVLKPISIWLFALSLVMSSLKRKFSIGHYLRDLQDISRVKVFSEATEKTRDVMNTFYSQEIEEDLNYALTETFVSEY